MSSNEYAQFIEALGGENQRGKLVVLDAPGALE
jgi:hypothetical protein